MSYWEMITRIPFRLLFERRMQIVLVLFFLARRVVAGKFTRIKNKGHVRLSDLPVTVINVYDRWVLIPKLVIIVHFSRTVWHENVIFIYWLHGSQLTFILEFYLVTYLISTNIASLYWSKCLSGIDS